MFVVGSVPGVRGQARFSVRSEVGVGMTEKTGAVMVVGEGISGVQTSLDLAESGFKVYLVER